MKSGFVDPTSVCRQWLPSGGSRHRRRLFISTLLTCLLLLTIFVVSSTMLFPNHYALFPATLISLITAATGFPTHSQHEKNEVTGLRQVVAGQQGAIASESSICSNIGRDLLLQGGNAADALVGTTFCVGVIGMYHSGIGGGGFMIVRGANGKYENIDFRETAPAAAFQDMFTNGSASSEIGGLAR